MIRLLGVVNIRFSLSFSKTLTGLFITRYYIIIFVFSLHLFLLIKKVITASNIPTTPKENVLTVLNANYLYKYI